MDLKASELYSAGIKKLESASQFEGKENIVAVVKTLVQANFAALDSNAAQARFTHGLGAFLLLLALVQSVSIWLSFKRPR